MMKKIDGGQQLIQGGKQLTHCTRGIEVHSLKGSEGIRWSIWDMGGQEEFHGFHYFMLPDLSNTGNPSLFLLVCSPYVLRDEGTPSKEKVKLPIEIEKELEYWLRFVASKSRRTISFKPKVIVVLTHSDKVPGLVARAQESVTSLKEQFAELLDVWSEPIAVDAFSTESGSNVASVIEDNIVTLLKALPPVYEVCNDVRSALKGWMVRNPKSPMMNWKTFSDLCQQTSLPGLVKAIAEESMIEVWRRALPCTFPRPGVTTSIPVRAFFSSSLWPTHTPASPPPSPPPPLRGGCGGRERPRGLRPDPVSAPAAPPGGNPKKQTTCAKVLSECQGTPRKRKKPCWDRKTGPRITQRLGGMRG
jgi:hypothetical protein